MAVDKGLQEEKEQERNELRDTGRIVLRSPAMVRALEWAIRFLLGAALAGGQVLRGASPFGVALVGASGGGPGAMASLLGSVTGYLLCRGLEDGLRYGAACILVFSVAFAFYDVPLCRKSWFMPLAAALLNGGAGLVTLTAQRWTAATAASFVGEMTLTGGGTYIFRVAFSTWENQTDDGDTTFPQRISLLLLGAAVLISLADLTLMGWVSVGRLLAVYAVLLAARAGGFGAGAAAGLAAGLAMDLSAGAAPFYAMVYGVEGLVCGLFRRQGRYVASLSGFLTTALILLWSWERAPMALLYEGFLASFLFLITPQSLLKRFTALFAGEPAVSRESWAATQAAQRLRATATAFSDLFSALRGAFGRGNLEDDSVIFDQAANRVCASCPLRERCWQTGYTDTYNCLNDALPQLLEAGQAEAAHFPQRFRDRCAKFPAFLRAVNEELSAHRARQQYQSRLGENRRAVCRQYGDVAQVLEETAQAMAAPCVTDNARTRRLNQFLASRGLNCQGLVFSGEEDRLQLQVEGRRAGELAGDTGRNALESLLELTLAPAEVVPSPRGQRITYRQAEPLTAIAGVAGRKKAGQEVSGDAGGWFKDEKGTLFVILCDGMGSGSQARQESELALRLLEKFLRAGVRPELALKTLNEALALRGEETGGFSTIDLLSLDLHSGRGTLYKLGAAPSYLRRGGVVTRLTGSALPAGLTIGGAREPDRSTFQMGPGDSLILLTDGVIAQGDDWVRDALASFDGSSPKALAEELVRHGEEDEDDQTALVLRVGLRRRTL